MKRRTSRTTKRRRAKHQKHTCPYFYRHERTPVENRLSELWSIMDFCNRGLLGSLPEFREAVRHPHPEPARYGKRQRSCRRSQVRSLMRRLKSDKTIIDDLPDKIEIDSYSTLTREQAGLYEKTLQKAMQVIEGIKDTDHKSLFARQGPGAAMILSLKQICNHPTQFLKNKVLDASLSGKWNCCSTSWKASGSK